MKLILNFNEQESSDYHKLIESLDNDNNDISALIMFAELIYKVSKKEGDI